MRETDVAAADEAPGSDPDSVARTICLRQLTGAARTRGQLVETLRRRGVPDDAAGRVLDRLTEVGLVDDPAFALGWVQSRSAGRGLARAALARELRTRGVSDEVVAAALDRLDPDEELANARALVARRMRTMQGLPPEARVRRLAGALARKGYPPGLAHRVVREMLGEERLQDSEPG